MVRGHYEGFFGASTGNSALQRKFFTENVDLPQNSFQKLRVEAVEAHFLEIWRCDCPLLAPESRRRDKMADRWTGDHIAWIGFGCSIMARNLVRSERK